MIDKAHQAIQFHYLSGSIYLPHRLALKKFILELFKKEKVRVNHINYIFCSDKYLLGINQQYLHHDTFTDIITFPFHGAGEPVLSDIYISIDRVRENAHSFQTSFRHELHRVIFHGALHLCGYKDKDANQAHQIRSKEDLYLSQYDVPRGTKL